MSFFLEDNRACFDESKARFAESLITLKEADAEISQPLDKILRLASLGKIDLYGQSGGEKILYGTLAIAPAQENPIEWPANCQNYYAQALTLDAEMHLKKPDNFVPDNYEFLINEIILLQPRHIPALLANKEIVIKYGWLSRGDAFKVIDPAEGMQIGRDGLLISTNSDWFKEHKQQHQKSDLDQAQQQEEKESFTVPPGTEWYDIRIHFVDTNNVEITIGKGKTYERNYKSLIGFVKKNNNKQTEGWLLLIALAFHRGDLPPVSDKENEARIKQISLLNKKLMNLFPGVDSNPFKAYKKGKGWEPRITLSLSKSLSEQYHT